jgi:hypothetical protein
VEKAVVQITDVPEEVEELSQALVLVRTQFEALPAELASTLLEAAVASTISALPSVSGIWRSEPTPYQLYVKALDKNLVAPLATDARIGADLLHQVKEVFLALPADIQARVLLTAIRHPSNIEAVAKDDGRLVDAAAMVRDLLSAGGIVSVKLAQMLAEHPKMPGDYRLLLGSLRDSNAAMRPLDFWWRVPRAIRTKITHLGPCLGTGSVKQVQLAQFEGGTEYAVAILRKQVEDEALSSINALETASDDLGPVARRLGKMVFGEFDLFNEGESLQEFAATSIGTHPLFRVVGVRHHSPNCLVEEPAKGRTIATVLDSPQTSPEDLEETKTILAEFHRTVFDAFISTGLIHSDIHLGNAVKVKQPDGRQGFVLFDVGQVERVNNTDMKAIMWTMAALSDPEKRSTLRDICIDHLLKTSLLAPPAFLSGGSSVSPVETDQVRKVDVDAKTIVVTEKEKKKAELRVIQNKLKEAFADAIVPFADGTLPDARTAFMMFLRASEKRGVETPKGAFAVAKMMDAMLSQQEWYLLEPVAHECMEQFLRKNITWGETLSLVWKKMV